MLLVPGNYIINDKAYRIGFPIIVNDTKKVKKVTEKEFKIFVASKS